MHELLQRQLEENLVSTESIPKDWQALLDAVSQTYLETDQYYSRVDEQSTALLNVMQSVAAGDLDVQVDIPEGAEILSELAAGLETMVDDLRATMVTQEESRKELERRAIQLATAAQVSQAATAILDPQELIQQVVDLALQRFDLYYAGLFLIDRTGEWTDEPDKWAVLRAGTGEAGRQMLADGHRLEAGGDSMVGQCIATKQARITLYAGEERLRFRNPYLPETRSEIALPLTARGQVIGAMTVQSDREAAFSDEDVVVFQTMADQVANAIENARLFQQTEQALVETGALNAASHAINQLSDRDEMLQQLANVVVDQLGYVNSWVALADEKGQTLMGVAGAGAGTTDEIIYGEIALDADARNPSMQAVLKGETIIVNDVRADDRAADLGDDVRAIVGRMVSVPIFSGTHVVGVIAVSRPTTTPAISEREADLLEAIADQAGIAIRNVSLFEQTQLALKEISCLSDIGRKVNETPSLPDFLQWITGRIPPAMKYDDVSVAAIEFEGAVYGSLAAIESPYQIVGSLQVERETVGRVTIAYTEERDFLDEESGLIGGIVRRVSSYIENRRLFEQTQANLAQTELLYRTSQAIGSSQSTEEILESLQGFAEFLNLSSISYREIAERDDDGIPTHINVYPYSRTQGTWTLHDPVLGVPVSGPAAQALVENPDQLVIFRDAQDPDSPMPERVRENMLQTGSRGALTVGLSARGDTIGYLSFVSPTPLDISERYAEVIIPTLADQAAIILDNIRLIERTERTLQETQSLYETSRAIAAANDAQQILDALVRSASLGDPTRCALVVFDEHDPGTGPDWMEQVAVWQREKRTDVRERRRHRMAALPSAMLWDRDRIVIINDVGNEERLAPERRAFLIETLNMQAAVIVPLVARGRWIGVYTIEFDQPRNIEEEDVQNYLAITSQAALALQSQRQLERIESRAKQEQMLREIIARVRGNDPETVARAAVRALGSALDRPTFIRLGSAEELAQAPGSPSDDGEERGAEGGE
jgi:GAF domain-containing protein